MRGEEKQQESLFISKCGFQALCVDLWSLVWLWDTRQWVFLPWGDGFNEYCPKCIGFCLFKRLSVLPLKKCSNALPIKSRKHLTKFTPQLKTCFPQLCKTSGHTTIQGWGEGFLSDRVTAHLQGCWTFLGFSCYHGYLHSWCALSTSSLG